MKHQLTEVFFTWGETVDFNISVFDEEDGNTDDGSIDCADIRALASIGHDDHSHDLNANENCRDNFVTESHGDEADNVFYVLTGSYTDSGAENVSSIAATKTHLLQPKIKEAEHYSSQNGIEVKYTEDPFGGGNSTGFVENGDYISFEPINLRNITHLTFRALNYVDSSGYIEIRTDSIDGPLLTTCIIPNNGKNTAWNYYTTPIKDPGGTHELFFVFKGENGLLFNLNWIEFHGQGVAQNDSSAFNGLIASYFNNSDFSGSPIVTRDPLIAFNWEKNPPITGINSKKFSVRWEGFLKLDEPVDFNLYTNHTGGTIKVIIDGTEIIYKTSDDKFLSKKIKFKTGKKYAITVEYVNNGDPAKVYLGWNENNTIHQSNLLTKLDDSKLLLKDGNFVENLILQPNSLTKKISVNGADNYNMKIYNIKGNIVSSKKISNENEEIDFSELYDNIYFVQIGNLPGIPIIKNVTN